MRHQDVSAIPRSSRVEVRNPLLALPAAKLILQLPPEVRALIARLLLELAAECRRKADHAWSTAKPPMACYWRACGVYCKHLSRVLDRGEVARPRKPRGAVGEPIA